MCNSKLQLTAESKQKVKSFGCLLGSAVSKGNRIAFADAELNGCNCHAATILMNL